MAFVCASSVTLLHYTVVQPPTLVQQKLNTLLCSSAECTSLQGNTQDNSSILDPPARRTPFVLTHIRT
jgi:hypothetical protein